MTLLPGTQLGPYEILAPLGAGGMGEVYRARDNRLGREVAVKVLPASLAGDPMRLRRFEEEARAAGAIDHPYILAIHDVGTHDGTPYAVTELLEGGTLRARLETPLPPRRVLEYALQVAEGLSAAHNKGIVHRDIKPENLFVTKGGRIKILDFGLAKRAADASTEEDLDAPTLSRQTDPGTVLGTAGYMAPEQVRGRAVDGRADIFSFGAVLYEMLSGRRAFAGRTGAERMSAILTEDPPEISASNPLFSRLERIARRCLEKEPSDRFQSGRDIVFALEAALGSPEAEDATPRRSRSVAVMPFKDLTSDPASAHLGLGLADAIITELALVKSLLVRPTAAILRYHGQTVEPQQVARELMVDAVLEGNLQRSGGRLRVTAQLVAGDDGHSLWGTKIDARLGDLFRMQDEVSRQIVRALEVELTPADERRLARAAGALGPAGAAYEEYVRGRLHLFRETVTDVNAAIESFERACVADKSFAPAWAGLADAYTRLAFEFAQEAEWHDRARLMCEKALALDPELPEGRYVRARLLWSPQGHWDHAGALRELTAALGGRPGLTEARDRLGVVLFHVGLVDEAQREFEQALAANPEDTQAMAHIGSCLYQQGNYTEALAVSTQSAPANWTYHLIALCHVRLGRLAEAATIADRLAREFPGYPGTYSLRGLIAALRGESEAARRQVSLTAASNPLFGHFHHAQYDVACTLARLGESASALDWLRQATRNGYPCHPAFANDAFLDPLRGGDDFMRFMDELESEFKGYALLYASLSRGRNSSSA
jgi:serine/threonine protein kinase/tetratricopeptide (TPR) repeat protein